MRRYGIYTIWIILELAFEELVWKELQQGDVKVWVKIMIWLKAEKNQIHEQLYDPLKSFSP